jgi:hypothetical protein
MPVPLDPADLLEALCRYVPSVTLYRPDEVIDLAGEWGWNAGLAGWDVFLFRDGTYLNTHWADISPLAIFGQGRWAYADACVELVQEGGSPHGHLRDRRFVPLTAALRASEEEDEQPYTMLLGVDDGYRSFMEKPGDRPVSYLLISALTRRSRFSPAESAKTKAELVATCRRVEGTRFIEPGA